MVKDKLMIIGFAPNTLSEAFEAYDESYEVWGINNFYAVAGYEKIKHMFTRWFEIHSRTDYADLSVMTPEGKKHIDFLKNMDIPVYVQDVEKFKDIPKQVYFPAKEMCEYQMNVLGMTRPYFSSTPTWLMFFAIYEAMIECGGDMSKFKWKSIELYGVDMAVGWHSGIANEYSYQRPSCEHEIGIVHGLRLAGVNIKFVLPKKSALLKHYGVYGYETELENEIMQDLKFRLNWLTNQQTALNNQINGAVSAYNKQMSEYQLNMAKLAGNIAEVQVEISNFDFADSGGKIKHEEAPTSSNSGLITIPKQEVKVDKGNVQKSRESVV